MSHNANMSPRFDDGGSGLSQVLRHVECGSFVFREHQVRCRRANPKHKHDYECIGFLVQGLGTAELAREDWTIRPGNINIIPRDTPHTERFGTEEIRWCGIEFPRVHDECAAAARAIFARPRQVIGGAAVDIARRIHAELSAIDEVTALALSGLGLELLAALVRNRNRAEDAPGPAWLRRAEEMLRARCLDAIALNDVAREVGVHPIHLARTFRAVLGRSVGEFIRERRIDRSKSRLAECDVPLSQIALDAGFADQSHFTRVFHRITGMTPNAYRRSLRRR